MQALDISSIFFTKKLLNKYYDTLDIDEKADPEYIEIGHSFDYACRSPNQITTINTENNNQSQVLTYDSAQNYYQSKRAGILAGPEWAEKVRLSKNPYLDGWVPIEDYINNIDDWKEHEYDVAFKCNWLKFTQNKNLAEKLLQTGDRPIKAREPNDWAETNAKILMIIREDLRRRADD